MVKKYLLDDKQFSSKTTAHNHVKALLKEVGICKSLKTKNLSTYERLVKILAGHYDALNRGILDNDGNYVLNDV